MNELIFILWFLAMDVKEEVGRYATLDECVAKMSEVFDPGVRGIWVCENTTITRNPHYDPQYYYDPRVD